MKTLSQVSVISLISIVIALFGLAGCQSDGYFPQYSGTYKLVNVIPRAKPSAAQLTPPSTIRITHRMHWVPNTWLHQMRIESVGSAAGQASGSWNASLTDLLNPGDICEDLKSGNCNLGGESFKLANMQPTPDSPAPGCSFYGYEYIARMVSWATSPDPALLSDIYPNRGKLVAGSIPPAHETLVHPEKVELDSVAVSEWTKQIAASPTTITLSMAKISQDSAYGCADGFPISESDSDVDSMAVVYERTEASEDTDLRTAAQITENSGVSGNLLDQMTKFK